MTDLQEKAMRMALAALNSFDPHDDEYWYSESSADEIDAAIAELRQALAQPDEMQERIDTLCLMYEQACKQKDDLIDQQREQIAALRKALARQELFALPDDIDAYERGVLDGMQKQMQSTVERAVNAMSQPLKQDWVGLTDADIDAYALDEGVTADKAPPWLVKYARDIEAKLKEKNT